MLDYPRGKISQAKSKAEDSKRFFGALWLVLGGFIGRKSDKEPGWQTIWKGCKRLQDMLLGADLF